MSPEEMKEIVARIMLETARVANWRDFGPVPGREGDQVFQGETESWRFMVASFPVDDEFGITTGYDGAATNAKEGLVVRLPRELAEEVFALASRPSAGIKEE